MLNYDFSNQLEEIREQKFIVDEILHTPYINPHEFRHNNREHFKFNKSLYNKNLGNVNSLIKGTKNIQQFTEFSEFKKPKKSLIIKPPKIAVIKKVTSQVKKPKIEKENKPLSFREFFKNFFPGCFLSKKQNDDIHISEKFARSYYDNYLKSGLSYKEFDNSMSI